MAAALADYQAFYRVTSRGLTEATWLVIDPAEPVDGAITSCAEGHGARASAAAPLDVVGRDKCYLNDLFVTPAARGQGVDRGLIEYVYARRQRAGCGTGWSASN